MSHKLLHDELMLVMSGINRWETSDILIDRVFDEDYCTTFHVVSKNKYGFKITRKKLETGIGDMGNEYRLVWDLGSQQTNIITVQMLSKLLIPEFRDIKIKRLSDV